MVRHPVPSGAAFRGAFAFKAVFAVAVLLIGVPSFAAPARAADGYTKCTVGDRVADDYNNKGTVTYVNADGSCGFKYDNSGMTNTYPPSVLHRVGKAPAAAAAFAFVAPGQYQCYAGENYTLTDIRIVNRSAYRDNKGNAGRYSFDPATQRVTFNSGTFRNSYAKYMAAGRIGLSSKPDTFFAIVCDLKH